MSRAIFIISLLINATALGYRCAQAQSTGVSSTPTMVPLSSPTGLGFDPYVSTGNGLIGGSSSYVPSLSFPANSVPPLGSSQVLPPTYSTYQPSMLPGGYGTGTYPGGYANNGLTTYPSQSYGVPTYNGPAPILPGAGQSAIVNTTPGSPYQSVTPGLYPNSTPSALFPGTYSAPGAYGTTGGSGTLLNDWFGGWFGSGTYSNPGYGGAGTGWSGGAWNPQGTVFSGQLGQPPAFIRLFQGPRFRHAYIHGNDRANSLAINDTDLSLAFLLPNFAWSTQPLYLLPSFSLHQWHGPFPHLDPNVTADLPHNAFSAFLDAGWQSDPARIFGAEIGVRLGMFSDFDAVSSRSFRILGRGIGRVRLTPQLTAKLGVMYVNRIRVKILPAGGILWQPNPGTRLDLFFPEPKLSAYLTTLGNIDTWWYVAGYYGGGTWTVERNDGTDDKIDINDVRIVVGLEWGRNDMMRDGRRIGFLEFGYVFERELLYKDRPIDSLDLQDNFVIRAGFGY